MVQVHYMILLPHYFYALHNGKIMYETLLK